MCGRFALISEDALTILLDVLGGNEPTPPIASRYNIAPTQPVLALWQAEGRRQAHLARWGLVPGWVRDPRDFPLVINARSETMGGKPAFRDSLRNQRCIVPASGYYEWHTGPGKRKTPFYIALADGHPMAMAGLFTTWMGPNGKEIDTLALVTTPANDDVAGIHHRMPAILEGDSIAAWLDTAAVDTRYATGLARPLPSGRLRAHAVSSRVNAAGNEGPDLREPADDSMTEPSQASQGKALKDKKKPSDQLDLF